MRLGGLVGVLFTLNLWFGLYRDPGEWPWTYVFIIFVMAMLALDPAGRSLGLDAMILRRAGRRGFAARLEAPRVRLLPLRPICGDFAAVTGRTT